MGISLPSLQDILGWLLHQLKTWLAILIDTKDFVRKLRNETRSDPDQVIFCLASFAAFIFVVDAIFSFPYDNFVLNLSIFSPALLFFAVAVFCIELVLSLVCLHLPLRLVAPSPDLRATLIYVLVMLAFLPIVNLAHAPIRLMFSDEEMQALYASNYEHFIQFVQSLAASGSMLKLVFTYILYVAVFVWFVKRATVALGEFYQLSTVRSFLVVITSLIAKGLIGAMLIGPLLLEVMRARPL